MHHEHKERGIGFLTLRALIVIVMTLLCLTGLKRLNVIAAPCDYPIAQVAETMNIR